jgi:DNA-binding MarR family transcriptional regulator
MDRPSGLIDAGRLGVVPARRRRSRVIICVVLARAFRALDSVRRRRIGQRMAFSLTPEAAEEADAVPRAAESFTPKQGQYLAFIYYYTKIHGRPPAEADFQRFFRVTSPVVHQMIKTLAARGFIDGEPGTARSIRLRLTRAQLPDLE